MESSILLTLLLFPPPQVRMKQIPSRCPTPPPPTPCIKGRSNRGHSGDDGRGICHDLSRDSLLLSCGLLLSPAPNLLAKQGISHVSLTPEPARPWSTFHIARQQHGHRHTQNIESRAQQASVHERAVSLVNEPGWDKRCIGSCTRPPIPNSHACTHSCFDEC